MPSPRRPLTLAQLLTPALAGLAGLAVLAVVASLSGCAAISNALSKQHEETFESYRSAKAGWVGVDIPEWIPHDATEVHNIATLNEIDAVMSPATSRRPAPDPARPSRHGCRTRMPAAPPNVMIRAV